MGPTKIIKWWRIKLGSFWGQDVPRNAGTLGLLYYLPANSVNFGKHVGI
jgi:hypothetical protein